jgi:hypothetical protein
MPDLIAFYRGTSPDSEGRTLADLWAFSDDEMEHVHDFIQWMFPLKERSHFNPDAPLLTDEDIAAFRADPALRQALGRSFVRFLAFLGLAYEGDRVIEAPDYAAKAGIWEYPNHNWLRITRVLTSTRMLGLEAESRAFFAFLEGLYRKAPSGIESVTFGYWLATQRI